MYCTFIVMNKIYMCTGYIYISDYFGVFYFGRLPGSDASERLALVAVSQSPWWWHTTEALDRPALLDPLKRRFKAFFQRVRRPAS